MAQRYDLRITVTAQKKACPNGHKIGDQWHIGRRTPEGICMGAFNSLMPFITAMRFGAELPWLDNPDVAEFCCPDPAVVNVFRIERIREE